jgi:UDP-N-acetylglucosamine 2-epimerase (non-hydrolysing)
MDRLFFKKLGLKPPKYNLESGKNEDRKRDGVMIRGIQKVLAKEKPRVVFVQGDTNSVVAGALAANKLGIKLAHHEAGLRSHNLRMIEETNRIITDHISDLLFAPTHIALKNLEDEGIDKFIFHSGNTIVDAVFEHIVTAEKEVDILNKLNLSKKKYFLVTCHRAENVDKKERFAGILEGIGMVGEKYGDYEIIFPMHPRTQKIADSFSLKIPARVRTIKPVGFHEFLKLEKEAKLIITDSGGAQEEACILKTSCVTIRNDTERPETLIDGVNILAGVDPDKILKAVDTNMSEKSIKWINPFGDGKAAEKIMSALTEELNL